MEMNFPTPPQVKWKDIPAHRSGDDCKVMEALMDTFAQEAYEQTEISQEGFITRFSPGGPPRTIGDVKATMIKLYDAGLIQFCCDRKEKWVGLEVWLPSGNWKTVFKRRLGDE